MAEISIIPLLLIMGVSWSSMVLAHQGHKHYSVPVILSTVAEQDVITLLHECPKDNSVSKIPRENFGDFYYRCENGDKILTQCPPGSSFNLKTLICEVRSSSGCYFRSAPPSFLSTPIPTKGLDPTTPEPTSNVRDFTPDTLNETATTPVTTLGVTISTTPEPISTTTVENTTTITPEISINSSTVTNPTTTMTPEVLANQTSESEILTTTKEPSTIEFSSTTKPTTPLSTTPEPTTITTETILSSTSEQPFSPSVQTQTTTTTLTSSMNSEQTTTTLSSVSLETLSSAPSTIKPEMSSTAATSTNSPSDPNFISDGLTVNNCIGKCPAVDPQYGAYLPHKSCRHFCQCSHGRPYLHVCPENLLWNPNILVCDWPRNVECLTP